MIYTELERRAAGMEEFQVHVSYMEIYQESGYDLLNPAARNNVLVTPFPKACAIISGLCAYTVCVYARYAVLEFNTYECIIFYDITFHLLHILVNTTLTVNYYTSS